MKDNRGESKKDKQTKLGDPSDHSVCPIPSEGERERRSGGSVLDYHAV